MNRKTRRILAMTEIIAGGTSLTALLGLLGTVGGMEQGSIGFGEGCIRAAVLLAVMGAGVMISQVRPRALQKRSRRGGGGGRAA